MVQSAYLLLIQHQELLVNQLLQHRCRAVRVVHQLILRHLLAHSTLLTSHSTLLKTIPTGQLQVVDEHLLLLGSTCQYIQCDMQGLFVAVFLAQCYVRLQFRFIPLNGFHSQGEGRIIHLADG